MSSNQKHSALEKQIKTTIIIAVVTVALIISYFTVFSKLLNSATEDDTPPQLLSGEVLGAANKIYMFEYLSSDSIQNISVSNENGDFSLSRSEADNTFYIDGNEDAPYNSSLFSSLVVAVGNTITTQRIVPAEDDGNEPDTVDFANYGLDEENAQAHFTVTSVNGDVYTVWIGYRIASGQGYYARLEGRNAVYILDSSLQNTVLGSIEQMVTPILSYPASSDDYHTIDYFTLWHNQEHFITIRYLSSAKDAEKYAAVSNYLMAHGEGISSSDVVSATSQKDLNSLLGLEKLNYAYTPAIDNYASVLSNLVSFQGDQTVALKKQGEESITFEQLKEYGIDPIHPAYEMFYSYQGVSSYVIFSEKTEAGVYYAYSYLFDLIAEISGTQADFLDWTFAQWVEPAFFQKNINNISEIKLQSEKTDLTFTLQSEQVDSKNTNLTVRESGKILDTDNFRRFYKVLLTRKIRDSFSGDTPSEDTLYLTLTITTSADLTTEYRFYQCSTQQMYMTINGDGEFYILSSSIKKLENDAIKAANNQNVSDHDRN